MSSPTQVRRVAKTGFDLMFAGSPMRSRSLTPFAATATFRSFSSSARRWNYNDRSSYAELRPNTSSSRNLSGSHAHTRSRPKAEPQAEFEPLLHIPKPPPQDFPPISERLRPLIPFFIYCTVLTSLAYNLLRSRKRKEEETSRSKAQVSVLEGLVKKLKDGEEVDEQEIDRELQMVGLKGRTLVTGVHQQDVEGLIEARDVGWKEVLFGRKRTKQDEEEQERKAEQLWAESEHQ